MSKIVLTEETIIEIGKSIPLSSFRDFFVKKLAKKFQATNFNLG